MSVQTTIAVVVLLYLAGLVLILFELLNPSLIFASIGVVAFAGCVWLGFTVSGMLGAAAIIAIAVGVPAYCFWLVRTLPKTRFGKRLFLEKIPSLKASGTPEATELESLIGKGGVAETLLRPAGAVRIDGKRYNAQAESGIIEAGEAIKVIAADMANIIVRRVIT